jgi:hypothetical protein
MRELGRDIAFFAHPFSCQARTRATKSPPAAICENQHLDSLLDSLPSLAAASKTE